MGKYLTALTRSFTKPEAKAGRAAKPVAASTGRKGLHVLYLLNDLIAQTRHDSQGATGPSAYTSLTSGIQPYLPDLTQAVVSLDLPRSRRNSKFHRRIGDLLDLWEEHGYYTHDFVNKLRDAAEKAGKATGSGSGKRDQAEEVGKSVLGGRDAPYLVPATHGDPSTPYYDLPAANMMPLITPNSSRPINTYKMKPLQFTAGPADQVLTTAVKKLLDDVERLYDVTHSKYEGIVVDRDIMGQPMIRDSNSGEVSRESYYGWSQEFCRKMKRLRLEGKNIQLEGPSKDMSLRDAAASGRSRSRSRTRSRTRSPSPRKRRRYSSEVSIQGQGRRGSFGSWSQSGSESDRRPKPVGTTGGHRNRNSGSRSRRRSRSPYGSRSVSQSHSPAPNYRSLRSSSPRGYGSNPRSRPTSPSDFGSNPTKIPSDQAFSAPHDPRRAFAPAMIPPPPPPSQFNIGFPLGPGLIPGGMPVPPPPPPSYNGVWPPPPPPPQMIGNTSGPQQVPLFPPFPPFPPVPPPPNVGVGYQMPGGHPLPNVPGGGWSNPPPSQRGSRQEVSGSFTYGRGAVHGWRGSGNGRGGRGRGR